MRYRLYRWFWTVIDWFFPPSCAGCNIQGTRWCQKCHDGVIRIMPPLCNNCGQTLPKVGFCFICKENPLQINGIRSWIFFKGPIRNAIHRLKYQRDIALGDTFAIPMIDVLNKSTWEIDLIAPVPLGVARQKERGYNQASLLAIPIALKLQFPYLPNALLRTRETLSQVDLSRKQRQENVEGAFAALSTYVNGKSILVIDDVATSSSTLDSCADALFKAGALRVYGLTLARTE